MSYEAGTAHEEAALPAERVDAERVDIERRSWPISFKIGLSIVFVFVLVAVFAPLFAPADPLKNEVLNRLAAPSWDHPLGTDHLGRDVLSRLIYAARLDLPIGFLAAAIPMLIGTTLGTLAGNFHKWADPLIMRSADIVQAFPVYVLVIAMVFVLGAGVPSILIAFAVLTWVAYARLIRAEILRVKQLDFIAAARVSGLSGWRVLTTHILPNSIGQTIIYFMSDAVLAILTLAAFSFLGLGIPPPTPEWGAMISEGQPFLRDQWWLSTVPGLTVLLIGISVSMVGDGIEVRMRS